MKQRNLMVLTLSCALLIIIELGVSIIYSDYIYNPAKGLISINVASQSYNDPNWEPGMENPTSSQNAANLMQEIDDWANSAKAAVIHKNAFSAGCGYSDYSGWLLSALGVSKAKDETAGGKGVYTTEGNSFNDAYTNDNILFPGKADLRILGTFSDLHIQNPLRAVPLPLWTILKGHSLQKESSEAMLSCPLTGTASTM